MAKTKHIKQQHKNKEKRKKKDIAFGSSSLPSTTPLCTFYKKAHPALLTGPLPTSCPPTPSPDGDPSYPPRQSGPGSSHLQCQHPPPSGTPLPLAFGTTVTPSRLSGRDFVGDQKQPLTKPRPSPRRLSSSTGNHNRRRRIYPLSSLCYRLWHSSHHNPTRHCQYPALPIPEGNSGTPQKSPRPLLHDSQ